MLVFFVLSGFIIRAVHRSDISRSNRLPSYARRRGPRLLPIYWMVLALVAASSTVTDIGIDGVPRDPGTILRTIFLLPQNPQQVGGTGAPILVVAWTLQYELLLYAAFGLFILDRSIGLVSVSLGLAAMLLMIGGGNANIFPAYLIPKYFAFFAMGVATSLMLNDGVYASRSAAFAAAGGILLLAGWLFDIYRWSDGPDRQSFTGQLAIDAAIFLASVMLIGGLAATERGDGVRAHEWQQKLGDWSYCLYLVHFPSSALLARLPVLVVFAAAGAALAAAISLCGAVPTCGCTSLSRRAPVPVLRQIAPWERLSCKPDDK